MIIVGCHYHPSFQQIAYVDTETGEWKEQRLEHREPAKYRVSSAQKANRWRTLALSSHNADNQTFFLEAQRMDLPECAKSYLKFEKLRELEPPVVSEEPATLQEPALGRQQAELREPSHPTRGH